MKDTSTKEIAPDDNNTENETNSNTSDHSEETLEPDAQTTAPVEGTAPDAQAQIAELTDRLQRTMADFDNFRKRTQKERTALYDDGLRSTIEKLLPVLDNFARAMLSPANPDDPFVVGMQMIFKQLTGALDDMGVCEIAALGESFNPEAHFAVSHLDDEQYGINEIIEVLQKGYKYKDKVIRPSMVRVAN